ncbi:SRPBCC family protein [Zafaria cholistanensis]|nr:SRPBCC family protein [Zafaria cholistanensis]
MTERTEITGTVADLNGEPHLVLSRTLDGRASDVWLDLTDSDRLGRWIGHWEGDPSSGTVQFFMTAEANDPRPERCTILQCDPPRRFACETSVEGDAWYLWFELAEAGGTTTLTFGQRLNPTDDVGSIGPGWEYYLDRLEAVRAGRDTSTVAWGDYFPALQPAYLRLVASG